MSTQNCKYGLYLAIGAAGSKAKLARSLGVTRGAISGWVRRGRIPSERIVDVEYTTGISRQLLRPDLFEDRDAA